MGGRKLHLRLFGAFSCEWSDGYRLQIRGAKHRALIALLATAAKGTHTRAWLQENLWSLSGEELGRASLRRALSDLRKIFGDDFSKLFRISNIDIRLRQNRIELLGDHRDGDFLEGIEIPEAGFRSWLREKRLGAISNAYEIPSVASSGISPSIAIIPFLPKEGGPVEGRFSDMLALEVTRALSRSKLIDVISHLSSRQIDQHTLDLNRIQASLGINYLVYGTTSIDGNEFRIDADFADAKTGRIYWTRAFTGKLSAVLDSSNKVVSELSSQIGQSILSASVELAHSRPLPNVESHALLMSAITFMHRHELASFSKSRVLLEELIRRAPDHSVLHAWLGKWYILSIAQGWSTNVTGDTIKASDCTKRALDINPACSFSLAIDGMILSNNNEALGVAASRFEEAVQIEPNNALAWLMFSRLNMFSGDGKKALKHADRACTLSPIDPHKYFFDIMKASAHSVCEDYLSALKYAQRSLEANPRHTSSHRVKAISLQLMGRTDDARLAVARLMKLEPNLTIENYLKNHPAADLPMGQLWADALQSAGVPVTAIKQ